MEYEDELIEKENSKIEDIVNNSKPKKSNKHSKNKGVINKSGKKELAKKKKEMYKRKEKRINKKIIYAGYTCNCK